ncbi:MULTISPECIES: hypothetical protein [Shewanella]|uniref:hypothetical protein n=1 Tax=Shewanella TaxID=22 RepID=UPI0008498A30|nr:hypothetical protein [Shewanella xiamenensis]MBW0298891.1 hypothetical protein [Shewanella xiamenensis]MCT8865754.1 hypothetical protein [Shewanella xiamenensis]MCT8869046.1 hypothetical protein [Shewanella xiamenensis]MCT8874394.1 hypothetical protein [Shewanella xiamenensis]MCT8878300.1 hypothetical protein [Shewanella xiamenensis]
MSDSQVEKNISYELFRAKAAFEVVRGLAEIKCANPDFKFHIEYSLRFFDAYSRWCGHIYETLKALVCNDPSYGNLDKYQKVDKAIQKFSRFIIDNIPEQEGHIPCSLKKGFSRDLRIVRNRCSFHCEISRIETELLNEFKDNHHTTIGNIFIYLCKSSLVKPLDSFDDLGHIEKFFNISIIGKAQSYTIKN